MPEDKYLSAICVQDKGDVLQSSECCMARRWLEFHGVNGSQTSRIEPDIEGETHQTSSRQTFR